MDHKTRNVMDIYQALYPRANVDRLYEQEKEVKDYSA